MDEVIRFLEEKMKEETHHGGTEARRSLRQGYAVPWRRLRESRGAHPERASASGQAALGIHAMVASWRKSRLRQGCGAPRRSEITGDGRS